MKLSEVTEPAKCVGLVVRASASIDDPTVKCRFGVIKRAFLQDGKLSVEILWDNERIGWYQLRTKDIEVA